MAESIQFILNTAGRYPLLTPSQELLYGRHVMEWVEIENIPQSELTPDQRRIARRGRKAYEKFYLCNLRLVISIAKRYTMAVNHLTFEDLFQEGCIGLSTAIKKFDPTRGYKFSTYSYWWVRQAITRAIGHHDRHIRLPGAALDMIRVLAKFVPEYKAKHGRMPSHEECMEATGVKTLETLKCYLQHTGGCSSLDVRAKGRDEKDADTILDLQAADAPNPLDQMVLEEMVEEAEAYLRKKQEDRRYSFLSRHLGLMGYSCTPSIRALARDVGLDRCTITREVNTARMNMKDYFMHKQHREALNV